jgi:hypothetical protein
MGNQGINPGGMDAANAAYQQQMQGQQDRMGQQMRMSQNPTFGGRPANNPTMGGMEAYSSGFGGPTPMPGYPGSPMPNPNNPGNPRIGPQGYDPGTAGSDFMADWLKDQQNRDWGKTEVRDQAEWYKEYLAVPYLNALNADKTLGLNSWIASTTADEQARVNSHGMGIADRGSAREDLALSLGQKNNERDHAYGVKEGDRRYGLDAELGRGTLAATNYSNNTARYGAETTRMVDQERNRIAQYEAQTGRRDVEGRQALDRFANDTARMGVENQYDLGKGTLGFENRRLDVDDSFRRDSMNQEATLTREKIASDDMNKRYDVFGRASKPNVRQSRSWY